MKTVTMDNAQYYIWSPGALTGSELNLCRNLLIAIKDNRITELISLRKNEIPSHVLKHGNFFCLENGVTLLPCLTDAHVHTGMNGTGDDLNRIQDDLDAFTARGVLAVRDGGDRRGINLRVRELIKDGTLRGPTVVSTGEALREHCGYGAFLGSGYPSVNNLPEVMDCILASGVDQVKVLTYGIVSFDEYGKVSTPLMEREALRYIVGRAGSKVVKVMAHASSAEAVRMSVEEGVDSVEHGYFLDEDSLKMMAEKEVTWVPTLIPVVAQVREPLIYKRNRKEIDIIKRIYEEHMEKLLCARKNGVPLGIGTDSGASGVKHGAGLLEEMLLYAAAGLSGRDVLQSATTVNAKTLGLEKRQGWIEKNKLPNLMAVQGDPLQDINALKNIKWLFYSDITDGHWR